MVTAIEIKNFFQQIKLDKLQLLHESEATGSRGEQLEQEQEQQEHLEPADEDDDDDLMIDEALINSTKDLFDSQVLCNSVLPDLEDEADLDLPPTQYF